MAHGPASHIVVLVVVENRATGGATITGTAAITTGATTSAASGSVNIIGTAATTTGATVSAATGVSAVAAVGTAAITTGATVSAASGVSATAATGTAAITTGATVSAATGSVAAPVSGTSAVTLGATISTASGVMATGLFPATVDATNRYWKDQNGNPWFGVGEAAWSLAANLSTTDCDTYLTDRAAKGVNFVMVNLVEHFYAANAPNNINNDAPFTGTAFQTGLNNVYWLVVDHMMAKALSLGITILACPAYIGFNGTEEGWDTEIAAATNTQFGTYGTNLANRYPSATYPNIVWLFGHDDVPTTTEKARYDAMGANLPAAHLIIPGGLFEGGAASGRGKPDWSGASTAFDADSIYTYHEAAQSLPVTYMQAIWTANTGPGGFLEGGYEGLKWSDQDRRDSYYAVLGAGGTYAFFGNDPIWKFGTGWAAQLSSTGSVQVSYVATLIAAVGTAWGPAVADTTNAFQTSGAGYCRYSSSLGLIYTTTGATVNLNLLSSPTGLIRWFDPTNGSFTTVGTFSGSKVVSDPGANSAGAQDWVMVVTATTDIAGTGAITLRPTVSAATGTVSISGTSAITTGATLSAATGSVTITGTAAITTGATTSAASGTLKHTGTAAITTGATVSAGVGLMAIAVVGTAAVTLARTISAGVGVYTAFAAIFRPPVVYDGRTPDRLWRNVRASGRGVNVYQLADGSYVESEPPPGTVILHTYLGGHDNPVTPTEVASLTAAGYGPNIV